MLNFNAGQITPEQQALISNYRSKWQQIALSTDKINRDSATTAINNAYAFIDQPQPNILFLSSPYTALEYIYDLVKNSWGKLEDTSLGNPVANNIIEKLLGNIRIQIKEEILNQLQGNIDEGLAVLIASEIAIKLREAKIASLMWSHGGYFMEQSFQNSELDEIAKNAFKYLLDFLIKFGFASNVYVAPSMWKTFYLVTDSIFGKNSQQSTSQLKTFKEIGNFLFVGKFYSQKSSTYQLPTIEASSTWSNVFIPSVIADYGYYIDYCHSVLNCDCDKNKWNIFYNLITNCGWIFPYEKTAIVCQHPIKINLNRDSNSERQKEVRIEFNDHFKIYENYQI